MRIFHKHFDTSLTAALRKEHYVTFALINIIRVLLWERSLFVCNLQHKHFTKSFTYSMVHLQNCQNFTLWEHSCKLQNFKLKLQIKCSRACIQYHSMRLYIWVSTTALNVPNEQNVPAIAFIKHTYTYTYCTPATTITHTYKTARTHKHTHSDTYCVHMLVCRHISC